MLDGFLLLFRALTSCFFSETCNSVFLSMLSKLVVGSLGYITWLLRSLDKSCPFQGARRVCSFVVSQEESHVSIFGFVGANLRMPVHPYCKI